MPELQPTAMAARIMLGFAEQTGLSSKLPRQRYLWTDAFAVNNFLGLARVLGEPHRELALTLVDRVHHALGRHRADDPRSGWISGLSEQEGERHPTRGGLRIGKPLPERGFGDRPEQRLEWERDGQYFHYLTQWMHALDQVSRATGQPQYNRWARELAETAHRAFTYLPSGDRRPRMVWKMSVDLSRPLVPSMGQHDALDGYVVCLQLRATRARQSAASGPDLESQTADFAAMIAGHDPSTSDPLGVGALLWNAYRLDQLAQQSMAPHPDLVRTLLAAALVSLDKQPFQHELLAPAERRLAFRELGLVIGLLAVKAMSDDRSLARRNEDRELLQAFGHHAGLRDPVLSFWLAPAHRQVQSWIDHRDINEVMLATALAPEGFLVLRPATPRE